MKETLRGEAAAVVPAAGRGTRLGAAVKKTYLSVAGKPLIVHTLQRLLAAPEIGPLWLVVAPEDVATCREEILDRYALAERVEVVPGGSSRQESVWRGLQAVPAAMRYVLVHDGARPNVSPALIGRCLQAARQHGAATAAVPVKDTLKRSNAEHIIVGTVDREWLWRIQTPQAFRRDWLWEAHRRAQERGQTATDDASLVEALGFPVHLVPGDEQNFKVTTQDDVALMERLLQPAGTAEEIRTGLGYDIHPLVPDRPLILGGVVIPHTHGLAGHSDADALTHAIIDALLGAAGLGDIGTHFPDTDPQYQNANSQELLRGVVERIRERFQILHVDSTVKAQSPRLGPHIPAMRQQLAATMQLSPDRINVKAKTGERMGPVGEGRAIETEAVATLRRRES